MSVRWAAMVTTLGFLAAGCAPARPRGPIPLEQRGGPIDTLAMRGYTYFLSNDLLRGRDTGSPGADAAALYITAACQALGLAPWGGNYGEPVPMVAASLSGAEVRLGDSAGATFRAPDGFVVDGGTAATLGGFAGPAVLVGSGDDILARPLGPDIAGAVAVMTGPLGEHGAADSLRAHGAVGVVRLTADETTYRLYARSRDHDVIYLADSTVRSSYFPPLPSIVAAPVLSRALLAGHGGMPAMGPLGMRVTVHLVPTTRPIAARNVGCAILGADPARRDSAIVFTAHYDHLGVGEPDERGDSIYNGFSDNAAGVAMLLAIAEGFQRAPVRPRHTMAFLFFTGEERGLLGSDYYVAHPPVPLSRILGVINLDAGAPPALVWSWRIAGGDSSALGQLAVDVALARGWSAVTSGPRANSDYFPFGREGVPAVFLVPGPAPYQGLSADSSQALRRRWDHYHQPADEWHDDFPFIGLERYAEYAYLVGQALDGGRVGPPGPTRR